MKAQNLNLVALAAATLLTLTGLVAINSRVAVAPVSEINGVKVIDLAPIEVRPTAEDMRTAALLADASVASAIAMPTLAGDTESSASLLGAQLAMPYYSFGKFGHASKE